MGKKDELLGTSFGAACNKLRKAIMFSMAKRLGDTTCFRCGLNIDTVDDLSVEHKMSWQSSSDPVAAFFDLENVAFSHLKCNSTSNTGGAKGGRARAARLSKERRQEIGRIAARERWRLERCKGDANIGA